MNPRPWPDAVNRLAVDDFVRYLDGVHCRQDGGQRQSLGPSEHSTIPKKTAKYPARTRKTVVRRRDRATTI